MAGKALPVFLIVILQKGTDLLDGLATLRKNAGKQVPDMRRVWPSRVLQCFV
jgi:hypothetical protein